MPKIRIPHYIERNTNLVKLQQILANAKNKDTSEYREENTFGKITTNTSLCQILGYQSI